MVASNNDKNTFAACESRSTYINTELGEINK